MDKEVNIKIRAQLESISPSRPTVTIPGQPSVTPQYPGTPQNIPGGGNDYVPPEGTGYYPYNIPRTPMPKRDTSINSRYDLLKKNAEEMFRGYASEANKYTTSGRESERYIKEKIGRVSSSSELDYNRQIIETSQRLGEGKISQKEATEQIRVARESFNEDRVQTRILKELLETLKATSKDEIRENAKVVQENLSRSKTVGVLGAEGDEFQILKERLQKEEFSDEKVLRKFNLGRYANIAMGAGGALSTGDIGGLAMLGGRGMMGMMGDASTLGKVGLAGGTITLATLAATIAGNASIFSKGRDYAVSTQTVGSDLYEARRKFGSSNLYQKMGMDTQEGMDFYAKVMRSSGGRKISLAENLGLSGITKSRDISEDLLMETIGNQRYSSSGSNISVVTSFERVLKDIFGGEFKSKLVQLPEMMSVYNSLAQQMIQTTGKIDSNALAGFVGGIREGFGVEGQNLQRYAGGLMSGFKGSQNTYLRKFQFAALRQTDPNMDYNQAMITLQNPASNPQYMRNYAKLMRSQGSTQYARWYETMHLGWEEAQKDFKSGNIDKAISAMSKVNVDKTSPATEYNKYMQEGQMLTSTTKEIQETLVEWFNKLGAYLGSSMINDVSKGVSAGISNTQGSGTKWVFEKP